MKSDAKHWNKTSIENLLNFEKQRYWMVFEEVKRYREQTTNYIDNLVPS